MKDSNSFMLTLLIGFMDPSIILGTFLNKFYIKR